MSIKKDLQNLSFITIGRMLNAGLQAVFYFIFAAILGPESFGQMTYLIALAGTVSVFSRFGLDTSVMVYRGKNDHQLSNQINVLAVISTTAAAAILLLIDITAAVLCFALSYFIMSQQNLLGLKKYKKFMRVSLIKGLAVIAITLLLYSLLDLPGILLGMAIGNFLGSFDLLKSLNRKVQSFGKIKSNYKVLVNNFGVSISRLARWADKLLIMPLLGSAYVGIYQFNLQILLGLEIFPLALYSFLLSEESAGRSHKKITQMLILFSVIVTMSVIILSPIFVNQFFPDYSEGIFSLQIIIISLIPLSFIAILDAKLQAKESTKIGYAGIIRLGSLLGLIFVLGDWLGLVGLSLAVLISVILNCIFLVVLYLSKNS